MLVTVFVQLSYRKLFSVRQLSAGNTTVHRPWAAQYAALQSKLQTDRRTDRRHHNAKSRSTCLQYWASV